MASPRTTTNIPRASLLLSLPLELREQIYHHAIEDALDTIKHPGYDLPKNERFSTHVSLRLVSRQVSHEVQNVWKKFARQVVCYFDNPPQLYDFWEKVKTDPYLHDAEFYLAARNERNLRFHHPQFQPRYTGAIIDEECKTLLKQQLGWHRPWSINPGLYWYDFERTSSAGGGIEGFKSEGEFHVDCRHPKICNKYRQWTFPSLEKSLRVTSFAWDLVSDLLYPERQTVGSLVLEGKLSDMGWDEYNMPHGRQMLAEHRRQLMFQGPAYVLEDDSSDDEEIGYLDFERDSEEARRRDLGFDEDEIGHQESESEGEVGSRESGSDEDEIGSQGSESGEDTRHQDSESDEEIHTIGIIEIESESEGENDDHSESESESPSEEDMDEEGDVDEE